MFLVLENSLEDLIVLLLQIVLEGQVDELVLDEVEVEAAVEEDVVVEMVRKIDVEILEVVYQLLEFVFESQVVGENELQKDIEHDLLIFFELVFN